MQFSKVIGHQKIKSLLVEEAKNDRISHAQMFLGSSGTGKLPLAIAFSQFLLCENPTQNDACGSCSSCTKVEHNVHPDLHFVFPVVNSKGVKSADDKRKEWNTFLDQSPYFNLTNWLQFTDEMGKNSQIGVEESRHILQKLSLKSYSGKYKIMILWLPEKMNTAAANKLLKVLEEPPAQTLFFLVCDSAESILPTIISRTQTIKVPPLKNEEIVEYLVQKFQISQANAESIANLAQGSVVEALNMIKGDKSQHVYFDLFVQLMRSAYAIDALKLMEVAENLAQQDKENQKNFLLYGLHIFRESLMTNYLGEESQNLRTEEQAFLKKFARFINNQNIGLLSNEFNEAYYHLERNANPKILFTDLVIKLTKMIKKGV
ncbi:MAG: DNA polymerase III subunit delta' [Putridiphycobacter sp.]